MPDVATTLTLPIRNTPNTTPMPSPTINDDDLTLWQAKTLKTTTRTPLPDAPNSRPWLNLTSPQLKRAINQAHSTARKAEAKAKKNPETKPPVSRKVWKREEIETLATMRESGCSWKEIQEVFHWRTYEGLKQIWWKYTFREKKMRKLKNMKESQKKGEQEVSAGSEMDMDVEGEGFAEDGKVKWNFRRKS